MPDLFAAGGRMIIVGDCRVEMARHEEASVDAVVTDPPYGLEFMGREWDHGVPGVPFWTEALRVLKPGGHLVAFGGTRTFHRLTCALEDSGFEIRDVLAWLYGSGFPKSLNVSKAIDKRRDDAGGVRAVCRFIRAAMDARGLKSSDLAPCFECDPRLIDHWAARDSDSQPSLPTRDQFFRLKEILDLGPEMDAEFDRLDSRKGKAGDAWAEAPVIGNHDGATPGLGGERFSVRDSLVRAPNSEAAAAWAGWGTALKPAWEPIILARKPLVGTVAANVLKFGTGALNVDGCRIGTEGGGATCAGGDACRCGTNEIFGATKHPKRREGEMGRWPANVALDEEAAAMLDEQAGDVGGGFGIRGSGPTDGRSSYAMPGQGQTVGFGDSGGASRFFYTAKASPADREPGNSHPTVKPSDLMRWLVRMITPPGGLVLDPFMGSGSTGVAAVAEGFRFLGIEQSADYVEIARRRIGDVAPLFPNAEDAGL